MISYLSGKILIKSERYLIVDVNGVGYKVFTPQRVLDSIAQEGGDINLFTYLAVKESAWELYGFLTTQELEFYELLLSISGIGPKTAMNILGQVAVNDLQEAIVLGEESIISRASGVSKKVAGRIILELKTKVKKLAKSKDQRSFVAEEIEVIDALVTLGYRVHEIRTALKNLPAETAKIEDKVKEALKLLGRK